MPVIDDDVEIEDDPADTHDPSLTYFADGPTVGI